MDPHKFDGIIRQLSQIRSRRALVGGSLGAAVLATIGVGEDALGQQVDAEHRRCLATGKRCGYTRKKKNGRDVRRPCKRCCQHHSVERPNGKKYCACIPTGAQPRVRLAILQLEDAPNPIACENDTECCSGVCGNGICQFGPCAELGQACNHRAPGGAVCCDVAGTAYPICNQTGDAAGTCVQCSGTGVTCDPSNSLCCECCTAVDQSDLDTEYTCQPCDIGN